MSSHTHNNALAVIPARYGSTRLPGKPLLVAGGKPIIQHVVERVSKAKRIARVVVATDDPRIVDAVKQFGGQAVLTSKDHTNGTSRIKEAVDLLEENQKHASRSIVVNVQGDEPLIEPDVIDALVEKLSADNSAPMATVASPFSEEEDVNNPNIVKVVTDQNGQALYFSRCALPFDRDGKGAAAPLKHVGVYAYRRDFLPLYVSLTSTPLEQSEQLEQLRVLEHGYKISVVRAVVKHHGIDTQEQYEQFADLCDAQMDK